MAIDNLKEYGVMWILGSLLFLAMITFATQFTSNNNPDALGDSQDKFDGFKANFTSKLVNVESEGNILLNISAESDPEVSNLGSRDSVASSYGITGSSGGFLNEIRRFFEWIIPDTPGTIIMSVVAGIFAFGAAYFITKWIRTGT